MDMKGVCTVLAMLTTAYPKYYQGMSEEKQKEAALLWFTMLGEWDDQTCLSATQKAISTNKFPPTIAEILETCVEISQPKILDAGDAWGEVSQAIRMYGYMHEAKALNSLSPITRKVVRSLGWGILCMSEDQMADRAHFLKIYDAIAKREKEYLQVPPGIRKIMEINMPQVAEKPKAMEAIPDLSVMCLNDDTGALQAINDIGVMNYIKKSLGVM